MKIKKIELKNYRNYDYLNLDLDDHLNIIIGDNAQGKTNLLESIYVLAVTKSFLSVNDKNLIKFNNDFSFINGKVVINGINNNLSILFNSNGKVVKYNGKEIKKLSDYIANMNVVIFTSDNIRVFKDSPSSRRKYFNIQISQINRGYIKILNDYNIILRQRNEFLKVININKDSDNSYLEVLNDKYVQLSLLVYEYRKRYVDEINKYLSELFKYITKEEGLELIYTSNIEGVDKNDMLNRLNKSLNKEIQYGMTMIGPNRDDYYFKFKGNDLSLFGSQGQIRSAILALKLAEVKLFTDLVGDSPILLLDDLFSELDIGKKNSVLRYLNDNVQTIITTTDINNINDDIRNKANVYEINNGKIISREIILKQEGDKNE